MAQKRLNAIIKLVKKKITQKPKTNRAKDGHKNAGVSYINEPTKERERERNASLSESDQLVNLER